jgi:MoaA/NifB/PqqE/SkfB family radical SAM enzyme
MASDFINVFLNKVNASGRLISYRLKDPIEWLPRIVYFSVNSVCNLKCRMCDIGQGQRDRQLSKNLCFSEGIELPLPTFKKVVDEVTFFQPLVCIVATEPLLYSQIVSGMKYVKDKGLRLSVTTNGFLLNKYAESLFQIEVDDLWISLDGTRQLNDVIRGVKGSFDRAIEGIRLINVLKERMESRKPKIHINFTISDLNYNHLVDFAKEMKNEKVHDIQFSHLNFVTEEMAQRHNERFGYFCKSTPSSMSKVNLTKIDIRRLESQIREVKMLFAKGGISFTPDLKDEVSLHDYYFRPHVPIGKKRCLVPWTVASIQPNGDAILLMRCFNYVVGNVTKQHFLEIWRGEEYRSFRKELWESRHFPACTRCCGIL